MMGSSGEPPVAGLEVFFEPRGVALVGARRSMGFGYGIPVILKQRGWGERISLVNPAGGELHGLPVHATVSTVPDTVDLAVLLTPAAVVPKALDEIGKRGIRHAIIESAGFAEVGGAGAALQREASDTAAAYGMRVIGPNCVGVLNTANGFSTVEVIEEAFTPGSTSIIAQSGVFGNCLLDMFHQVRLQVAKAVTLGDRMDVDECDMLEYMGDDPQTDVIMMYLEGAADGVRLKRTLEEVSSSKPVLVLKSGSTVAGAAATSSHTGSLSGEDVLYECVFTQTGTVRASSLESLVEMARAFSVLPKPRGNRLGVVTSSGSLGVMATDAAVSSGLEVPALPDAIAREIAAEAPLWMNVKNPLDVGPSWLFPRAVSSMMENPDVDMVLVIAIIPYAVFRELREMGFDARGWFGDIEALRESFPEKPLAVCAVGHADFVNAITHISGPNVPVYTSPEPAARSLATLFRYWKWREDSGSG